MSDAVSLVAAKEHTLDGRRRPVTAHVIVCHDLNTRVQNIMGMWSVANHADRALLETLSRDILNGILEDATILEDELRAIKRWARSQLGKLPTPIKENH